MGGRPGRFAEPATIFRLALAEDPEFASAYHMLGWSVRFDDREEALMHWTTAMELSPNTTERDRLFIEGTYHRQMGHLEEGAAKFEALLALQPDHGFTVLNLLNMYDRRSDDWVRSIVHGADHSPNNVRIQVDAAASLMRAERSDRWQRYAMRASELKPLTPEGVTWANNPNGQFVWLNFVPADVHWSRGEIDEAYQALESLTRTIDSQPPEVRDLFLTRAGAYRLAFGQVQQAADLFERLSDVNVRASRLSWVASCLDDRAAMREQLIKLSPGTRASLLRPLRVVRSGLPLDRFDFSPDTSRWQLALGELAFRRGDLSEAVERFEQGLEGVGESFHAPHFFDASESLASALQGLGHQPRALRVLEGAARRSLRNRTPNAFLSGAFGRFRVQARLASEYRKLGRVDEAVAIENEVLRMLKYADADHPVVGQITESRASL